MRVQQTLSESCLGYSAVDMLDLFSLECDNCGISDITGLEYASNLISLSLTHNQISGLSPVAAPTHLTNLNMNSNNFSDLTALSGLMGLTGLNIHRNPISDISPLAPLINVQSLEIRLCDISDVSPPAGMTDLERLIINDNLIANPLLARPGLWLNADDPTPSEGRWLPGDYHARFTTGRWHPESQTWQVDTKHSPALDTGDPDSTLALEQQPHGGRINCGVCGVCGGTPKASLTSIASN